MAFSLRLPVTAAVLLSVAAACQTTPRLRGRDTEVLAQGQLADLQPVDIAVAPIRLTEASAAAPVAELRRAAQLGLVRRRYSPLSTALVDEAVAGGVRAASDSLPNLGSESSGLAGSGLAEAAYAPGLLGEDAVLEVDVLRWDARNWDLRRSLDVEIEARLVDPRNPLGPELWAARFARGVDLTGQISVGTTGDGAIQKACNIVFIELLAKLPARRVEALEFPAMPGPGPSTDPVPGSSEGAGAARGGGWNSADDEASGGADR